MTVPGRAALTEATERMQSRSPDKAVRRYPGPLPPVALRLPRLRSECNRVARIRRYAAIRDNLPRSRCAYRGYKAYAIA